MSLFVYISKNHRSMEGRTLHRHQWMADHVLIWEPAVRRWLRRCVRTLSSADIDDVIQEAYARVWRADFSLVRNGRSLFFTVASNIVKDQLRRSRVVPIECVAELESLNQEEAPDPERWLCARQQYERLLEAVKELAPRRRTVFEARKFEGLSQREIAKRMGVAEKTVDNHMRLALADVIKIMLSKDNDHCSPTERPYLGRATKRD